MGFIVNALMVVALFAFLFYNMDMLNKIRSDVQYIRAAINK